MASREFWLVSLAILLLLLSPYYLRGKEKSTRELNSLNKLIDDLAGPYDLKNTIRALVWLESKNGEYPINLQDPACGIMHININTYMRRHKIKNTPFNRNKACADLIASPKWAILNAIDELMFWQNIHCGKYECDEVEYKLVIKSYNAGWKYKGKQAQEYWEKFKDAYNRVNKKDGKK